MLRVTRAFYTSVVASICRSTFVSSSLQAMCRRQCLPQTWSQQLGQGVAGCDELCHARIPRQHRRPVLRRASLLLRHRQLHRRPRGSREKPGELIGRSVQPFFRVRLVTCYSPSNFTSSLLIVVDTSLFTSGLLGKACHLVDVGVTSALSLFCRARPRQLGTAGPRAAQRSTSREPFSRSRRI